MAATMSQRKLHATLSAMLLSELPGWTLHVACRPCGRQVDVPLARLPQDQKLWRVLWRLRCRTCHAQPSAIVGAADRGRRVKLGGPGAYG